ncbi:MAG: hypothetical protein KF709_02350 [Gemmatimonadaceae bacterium]|nr:hypothetical protein [Gemmatimonadaceae bacterium]
MTHVDLGSVLRDSTQSEFRNLVTRDTGAKVRIAVERQLAGLADGTVMYLDFSHIGLLDRSCADEFLNKLMLSLTGERPAHDGYVMIHGVNDLHMEIIETVLEAHSLALVVRVAGDGAVRLVGAVTDEERRCWDLVMQQGEADADVVAAETGIPCEACGRMLDGLARRRLLRREAHRYLPLGSAA